MNSSEDSIDISETDETSPLNTSSFLNKRKFSALFRQDTNDFFQENLDYLDDEINDEMNLKLLYKRAVDGNDNYFKHWLQKSKSENIDYIKKITDAKFGEDKLTILHIASKHCQYLVVKILVEEFKMDIDIKSKKLMTPLQVLIASNGTKNKSNAPSSPGVTQRNTTLCSNQQTCIDYLIDSGANVYSQDYYGLTAMHYAAIKDNFNGAKYMIDKTQKPIQVDMKDKERLTPLDYSCKFGSWDLADLLIGITRPISLASNEDNLPLSLHYAISNKTETTLETVKMVETVKKMLEIIKKSGSQILNQSLNAKYHNDYTLLHISIENNYFDLAKLLIEDYNNRTNIPAGLDKNLPIHLTAMTGSIQMFDLLVKHRSKINTTNAKNENCLHLAAISNKPKFIEHFLKVELDIYKENLCYKATNLLQFTPLMAASYSGSLDSIKILTGPNIAYDLADKDIDDHCIFHLCAKKNQLKCLKYLIDSLLVNDDSLIHYLGQKDKYDNTILHIICANGFYDMLVYILEKISKNLNLIFRKNYYEESCFHLCCKEGHERIARKLLKTVPNRVLLLEDKDGELNTPLHLATLHQKENVVKLLLENGASVTTKNVQHYTALDISCQKNNTNIFDMLIEFKSPINSAKVNSELPIHFVCRNGNAQMLKSLLYFKADPTTKNKKGQTPFDIALKKNHAEIIEVFLNLHDWPKLLDLTEKEHEMNENIRFKCLNKNRPEMITIILNHLLTKNERRPYEFGPLDPSFKYLKKISDHPLFIISKTDKEYLLKHEVINTLVDLKWKKLPRTFYFINLITYAIFLFLLTYHLLTAQKMVNLEVIKVNVSDTTTNMDLTTTDEPERVISFHLLKSNKYSSNQSIILLTFNIVLLGLHFLKELFQIYHRRCRYFYALDNNLELFTYILSIIFLFPPNTQISEFYRNQNTSISNEVLKIKSDFQWGIGSLCGLSGWIVFALFLQKLPKYGIYAVMFRKMLIKSVRILPVFVILLTGFTVSFYFNKNPNRTNAEFFSVEEAIMSFVGTMEMMVGGEADDDLNHRENLLRLSTFFFFMCLMCIMLLNLLIGIAIGEIKKFYEEAEVKLISMKIKYILSSQQMLFNVMSDDSYMTFRTMNSENFLESTDTKFTYKKCKENCRAFLRIKDKNNHSLFESSDSNVKVEDLFKNLNKNIDEKFDALNSIVLKLNNEFTLYKESINPRTRRISN